MSRVGKQPIELPSGVTITIDDKEIAVNGSKGTLKQTALEGIKVEQKENSVILSRKNDQPINRAKHGLMRALLNNMVIGVNKGFEKKLEINGVGYRVNLAGSDLKMNLGYSHEVVYSLPQGVNADVQQNNITISGIDKQQVGQVAAEIRSLRKPEPYKGKGIKYADERIIRKAGKSGKEK